MMKEEKILREFVIPKIVDMYNKNYGKETSRLISALVRAVREEDAKLAEDLSGKMNMGSIANAGAYNIACKEIAAAIRGKK